MNMKHSVFLLACFLCLWCIKHEFSQEKVDPGWHPIWASDSLHTVYPSPITRYIPLRRWHIQGWAWQRCSGKEHRLVWREAHHPQRSPAVLTQCGGQDCWCPSPHLAFEDGVLRCCKWSGISHGFIELRYLKLLMFLSWNVRTSMDLSWTWWVNVRCGICSVKTADVPPPIWHLKTGFCVAARDLGLAIDLLSCAILNCWFFCLEMSAQAWIWVEHDGWM